MSRPPNFADQLRAWRGRRGVSQLDLAIAADVSQRHISFLETGRARPSAAMVRRLADELGIALREQNELLLAAGYAPAFPERPLEQLGEVSLVIDRILAAHEPHVAFVVDRAWNVLRANTAASMFLRLALGDPPQWAGPPLNIMRISLHPLGLRRTMADWRPPAARLVRRLQRDALAQPHETALRELLAEVSAYPDVADLATDVEPAAADLVISTEYALAGERLSLFTTIMTIGDAIDLTLAELRLETLWPADPESAAAWQRLLTLQLA